MQLLIEVESNEFGKSNCNENEARILSAFSASKKSTGVDYLTSSAKKGRQTAKKSGKDARRSKYLTTNTKKAFNLLWHTFTQALIF